MADKEHYLSGYQGEEDYGQNEQYYVKLAQADADADRLLAEKVASIGVESGDVCSVGYDAGLVATSSACSGPGQEVARPSYTVACRLCSLVLFCVAVAGWAFCIEIGFTPGKFVQVIHEARFEVQRLIRDHAQTTGARSLTSANSLREPQLHGRAPRQDVHATARAGTHLAVDEPLQSDVHARTRALPSTAPRRGEQRQKEARH